MRLLIILLLGLMAMPAVAAEEFAVSDTPANRQMAAQAYFKAQNPSEMIEKTTSAMAAQLPANQRGEFVQFMHSRDLVASMMPQLQAALVQTFSVKEIEAMTRFYGSPEGQSIMQKMPNYVATIMPIVQANVVAMVKTYVQAKQAQAARQGQTKGQPVAH